MSMCCTLRASFVPRMVARHGQISVSHHAHTSDTCCGVAFGPGGMCVSRGSDSSLDVLEFGCAMLRAIAHAREATNNELNHAYDKWEEFQDKKSVARETRVQNDKVYAEIQKAKEYENKDNNLNKLHDQVTSLTKR